MAATRADSNDSAGESQSFWLATSPSTSYPTLASDLEVDVAIVGAGIVGVTAARLLVDAGRSVAMLEAGQVASGVTGHTTAKVTSLHTLIYDHLIRHFGSEAARTYGEANEAALAMISRLCGEHAQDCELVEADAYTFAANEEDREAVEREAEAAVSLGLPASFDEDPPLPFATHGAVRFGGQAKFHPRKYLLRLAESLAAAGDTLFEQTRVVEIDRGNPCVVRTEAGHAVAAEHVIVATHAPIIDAKLLMARATADRGYALALEAGEWVPDGMFITASAPSRSVRGATLDGSDVLIVSGEGHPVGEPDDGGGSESWSKLAAWARDELGAGEILYRWSTQDYYSHDRVPFIGALDARHRIYAATAFGGWGMTTGTVAGMLLRDLACEVESPWAELYDPGRLKLAELPGLLKKGVHDARRLVGDRVLGGESVEGVSTLVRGEGDVFSVDGEKLAVHRDIDGSLRAVSAVCTHLGCIVGWNGAEQSWDCPCHGSRFSAAGEVLQGPASEALADRTASLVEHTALGA